MRFIFREEKLFTLGHVLSKSHNWDKTQLLNFLVYWYFYYTDLGDFGWAILPLWASLPSEGYYEEKWFKNT